MGRPHDNTPISVHQAAGAGAETWSEVSREISLRGYLLQSLPATTHLYQVSENSEDYHNFM